MDTTELPDALNDKKNLHPDNIIYPTQKTMNFFEMRHPRKWWEKINPKIVFLVAALTVLSLVLELPRKAKEFYREIIGKPVPTTTLKGVVVDSTGNPIEGAQVRVDELPGTSLTTNTDGLFIFRKIEGKPGDQIRVYVKCNGFQSRNEFVVLPGPKRFILKKLKTQ